MEKLKFVVIQLHKLRQMNYYFRKMFGIISSILQLSVFIQKGTSKPKPPVVVEHSHSTEVNGGGLNDCVKMTAFHDSLLAAVDDTKCLFEFNANYECTIPVIEVVVNCIKGLKVNKQCVRNIHEILETKDIQDVSVKDSRS